MWIRRLAGCVLLLALLAWLLVDGDAGAALDKPSARPATPAQVSPADSPVAHAQEAPVADSTAPKVATKQVRAQVSTPRVLGRVVHQRTGRGIADVPVVMGRQRTRSGPDGRFELGPPPHAVTLRASWSIEQHPVRPEVEVDPSALEPEYSLVLGDVPQAPILLLSWWPNRMKTNARTCPGSSR